MIEILEHSSSSYGPRTYANAHNSDVTIALAVDYTTAGERLTHKAAGEKYLKLDPVEPAIANARKLWRHLKHNCYKPAIINVAGNGIYTLHKHGWDQQQINNYLLDILHLVSEHMVLGKIISGGQTGVDIAGGWAAVKLGIDCTLTLPEGFKQRHEDGIDVCHTREEILAQLYA
jgi:hypothetical protein